MAFMASDDLRSPVPIVGPLGRVSGRLPRHSGAEHDFAVANDECVLRFQRQLERWLPGIDVGATVGSLDGGQVTCVRADGLFVDFDVMDAIDRVMVHHDLAGGRIELAVGRPNRQPTDDNLLSDPSERWMPHALDASKLHATVGTAGVLINGVDHLDPCLAKFAEAMDVVARTRSGMNLYVSAEGVRGFGPHWDDHHVLAIQLHGTKHWDLEAPIDATPSRGASPEATSGDVVWSGELSPGDVLWIPRGVGHRTLSGPGISVHLACYVQPILLSDLACAVMARSAVGPVAIDGRLVQRLLASSGMRIRPRARGSAVALTYALRGGVDEVDFRTTMPGGFYVPEEAAWAGHVLAGGCQISLPADLRAVLGALGPCGPAHADEIAALDPNLRLIRALADSGLVEADWRHR